MFGEFVLVNLYVTLKLGVFYFIHFCENYTKWHLQFSEVTDEFQVDFLRFDATVDQDEHADQILSVFDITVEHHFPRLAVFLGTLCKTISWQVDQIPLVVDYEVIYRYCLSRSRRCLCKLLFVCQHID